jgi:hypothetical protein
MSKICSPPGFKLLGSCDPNRCPISQWRRWKAKMPPYDDRLFAPPAAVLNARLRNPQNGAIIPDVSLLIDTGADVTRPSWHEGSLRSLVCRDRAGERRAAHARRRPPARLRLQHARHDLHRLSLHRRLARAQLLRGVRRGRWTSAAATTSTRCSTSPRRRTTSRAASRWRRSSVTPTAGRTSSTWCCPSGCIRRSRRRGSGCDHNAAHPADR